MADEVVVALFELVEEGVEAVLGGWLSIVGSAQYVGIA